MPLTSTLDQELLALAPATTETDAPSLAAALAAIRADSVASSDNYLNDTVVPHGGE